MPDPVNTPPTPVPPRTTAAPADTTSPMSTTRPPEPAKSSPDQSSSTTSATSIPTASTVDPFKAAMEQLIAEMQKQLRLSPPQSPTSKAHVPFLVFAGLVTAGILTLIGLGDTVPTSIYALDASALIAAGVSVVPS